MSAADPTLNKVALTSSDKLPPYRNDARKFLTLPNELLTIISDAIEPGDLPNFRLTCRTLNDVSSKHFGEKRLAHRRFIFTEYSMTGLMDMTAHSVFGPCIKSVLFGTHCLTNNLDTLMKAIDSSKVTDIEAMVILRKYHTCWDTRSRFYADRRLSRMLVLALSNLRVLGNQVALGVFNDVPDGVRGLYTRPLSGYGSEHQSRALPFVKLMMSNVSTLSIIFASCNVVGFSPHRIVLDLSESGIDMETSHAFDSFMLGNSGHIPPTIDACIKDRQTKTCVSSSQSSLSLRPRILPGDIWTEPENRTVSNVSLNVVFRTALATAHFRRFRMDSCSIQAGVLLPVLRRFRRTLQVVELINIAIWVGDKYDAPRCVLPVLCTLRDDLQLQELVMDNVRAYHEDYYNGGILVANGRSWYGQQQIHQGLSVFIDFGADSWDGGDSDEHFKKNLSYIEADCQLQYADYVDMHKPEDTDYIDFLQWKGGREAILEEYKLEYEEEKLKRGRIREVMAAVEALRP
ncbi:hypothetical protein D6D24_07372 [Aureobasidium pullulans]|uniref:F-box domain-containing protein n=1 Tax=Aureobasidium pullulans TaxID=5580 RepID=A0A4V4IAD5_AURPU|nr:hypothetical protein D6D24_07372 [Aureobasidium pullulans]